MYSGGAMCYTPHPLEPDFSYKLKITIGNNAKKTQTDQNSLTGNLKTLSPTQQQTRHVHLTLVQCLSSV